MEYNLVSKFLGYASKPDPTNVDARYLVAGSFNCLVNDSEKIETRKGYQVDGAENATVAPVESSYDWDSSSDIERNLRAANAKLQLRYEDADDNISWEDLFSLPNGEALSFATWWDNSRKFDVLLFVDGSDDLLEWSGAVATYASCTVNTVTIEGSDSVAAKRFHTSGTRGFRIKDTGGTWREFTYTGETGTQFTTVTPDPTAFTFDVGAPIFQSVRTNSNTPASGFNTNMIRVMKNQVVFGSRTSRLLYISANDDYTDFTPGSPRVAGDGDIVTLDNSARALAVLEETLFASAGTDDWYRIKFEQIAVGSTLTEQIQVKKRVAAGRAALHHDLVENIDNAVVFIDQRNALRYFGDVENFASVQMRSLSNPVKPDFDVEDFTGGHIKAHDNRIYVTAPENSRVWINELSEDEQGTPKRFWQPPQVLPFQRMANIGGELYAHSNATPETFQAFTGYSDRLDASGENGRPISVVARFAYRQFDKRGDYKTFEYYRSEGYISTNTDLTLTLNYDYGGATDQKEKTIDGEDTTIRFVPQESNVLGDTPLGDLPLGVEQEQSDMPKFIVDHHVANKDFFELQAIYSSSGVDQRWQLLAHGPLVRESVNKPTSIRQ